MPHSCKDKNWIKWKASQFLFFYFIRMYVNHKKIVQFLINFNFPEIYIQFKWCNNKNENQQNKCHLKGDCGYSALLSDETDVKIMILC